jgi:hypothetical protein
LIDPSLGSDASASLERRPDVDRSSAGTTTPRVAARPHQDQAGAALPATDPDFALSLSPASLRLAADALAAGSADSPAAAPTAAPVATRATRGEPSRVEEPSFDQAAARSARRDPTDRIVDAYRAVEKAPVGTRVRVVA